MLTICHCSVPALESRPPPRSTPTRIDSDFAFTCACVCAHARLFASLCFTLRHPAFPADFAPPFRTPVAIAIPRAPRRPSLARPPLALHSPARVEPSSGSAARGADLTFDRASQIPDPLPSFPLPPRFALDRTLARPSRTREGNRRAGSRCGWFAARRRAARARHLAGTSGS